MRLITSLAELKRLIGQDVAVSEWIVIDQTRIDLFAQASGDFQWIHRRGGALSSRVALRRADCARILELVLVDVAAAVIHCIPALQTCYQLRLE